MFLKPTQLIYTGNYKNNIESPSGKFIIGDFGCNSFDYHGVIRKIKN